MPIDEEYEIFVPRFQIFHDRGVNLFAGQEGKMSDVGHEIMMDLVNPFMVPSSDAICPES